jgi:hypothetical protein
MQGAVEQKMYCELELEARCRGAVKGGVKKHDGWMQRGRELFDPEASLPFATFSDETFGRS